MASHLPQNWIPKLCADLSIPGWSNGSVRHEVIRLFRAWSQAEGGKARWNPLNSTGHVHSAEGEWQDSDYNSVGVCNYKKPFYGISATASTLLGGHYEGILAGLRGGQLTAEGIVKQYEAEFKLWGTNPVLMLEVLRTTP